MKKPIIAVVIILLIALLAGGAYYMFRGSSNGNWKGRNMNRNTTTSQQVKTASGSFALSEVQSHNTKDNCWFAVDGKVYNLTEFIASGDHKGGMDMVIQSCGTDATSAFNEAHGSGRKGQRAQNELEEFLIGNLK